MPLHFSMQSPLGSTLVSPIPRTWIFCQDFKLEMIISLIYFPSCWDHCSSLPKFHCLNTVILYILPDFFSCFRQYRKSSLCYSILVRSQNSGIVFKTKYWGRIMCGQTKKKGEGMPRFIWKTWKATKLSKKKNNIKIVISSFF